MCGRYIIVSKLKKIEKRFNAKPNEEGLQLVANFNVSPGDIAPAIKDPRLKHADLIEPTGERLLKEYDYELHRDLELSGMGMSSSKSRRNALN